MVDHMIVQQHPSPPPLPPPRSSRMRCLYSRALTHQAQQPSTRGTARRSTSASQCNSLASGTVVCCVRQLRSLNAYSRVRPSSLPSLRTALTGVDLSSWRGIWPKLLLANAKCGSTTRTDERLEPAQQHATLPKHRDPEDLRDRPPKTSEDLLEDLRKKRRRRSI